MNKSASKAERALLQKQAAKMLIVDGLLQKNIAAKIGVTEKTITAWARKYKWNEAIQKKEAAMQTTHYLNLTDFEAYLLAGSAEAYKTFKKQLAGYLEANKPVQRILVG